MAPTDGMETAEHFEMVSVEANRHRDLSRMNTSVHGHTVTLIGARVYVLGDIAGTRKQRMGHSGFFYLELVTCSWFWLPVLQPLLLKSHYAFLVEDCIVAMTSREIWKFDPLQPEWLQMEWFRPMPFELRDYCCEFVVQLRTVLCFGRLDDAGKFGLFAANLDSLDWTIPKQTGMPPSRRNGHCSCTLVEEKGTTVFIFGGRNLNNFHRDLYALHCSPAVYRWSQPLRSALVDPVAYAAITIIGGCLFVYGGFMEYLSDSGNFVKYNVYRDTWTNLSLNGNEMTSFHKVLPVNTNILVFGGYSHDFYNIRVIQPLQML